MSKVSICIPAYKDVSGICRLFNSIKEQDYRDFDVIITDDTPDDSVAKALDACVSNGKLLDENGAACDINVMYEHNPKPLGPAGNWNLCISKADGDYIKIMHQDDFFTDSKSLSSFVRMLDDDPDSVLAFSGSRQVTIHEEAPFDISDHYDRHIKDDELSLISRDWRNIFLGGFIGAPSATIYRKCDARFDPALKWLIDSDFYMNLLSGCGNAFSHTNEPLVSIGVSSTQLTNSCAKDADVNVREHRHLYLKYSLGELKACREKMTAVVLEYRRGFKDIKDLGIPKGEYLAAAKAYRRGLRKFYSDLLLRKLHIRK